MKSLTAYAIITIVIHLHHLLANNPIQEVRIAECMLTFLIVVSVSMEWGGVYDKLFRVLRLA